MAATYKSKHCGYCGKATRHAREKPNHLLHLILTVCTAGCWLPVWMLIGLLGYTNPWLCQTCGNKN